MVDLPGWSRRGGDRHALIDHPREQGFLLGSCGLSLVDEDLRQGLVGPAVIGRLVRVNMGGNQEASPTTTGGGLEMAGMGTPIRAYDYEGATQRGGRSTGRAIRHLQGSQISTT